MLKNLLFNRVLQNALCVVAIICLFSACSSVGFQKRKYTRGVYFSSAHKPLKVETKSSAKKTQQNSEDELAVVKAVKTDSPRATNAVAPLKKPEIPAKRASKPATSQANTSATDRWEADKQPLKITQPELRKQQNADATKKGVLGLGMKIVLVCVLIVLAVLVIVIIGLT